LKIDVEGSELSVLDGARTMLERMRPTILIEVADSNRMSEVSARLTPLAYTATQLAGFEPWNYIFRPSPK